MPFAAAVTVVACVQGLTTARHARTMVIVNEVEQRESARARESCLLLACRPLRAAGPAEAGPFASLELPARAIGRDRADNSPAAQPGQNAPTTRQTKSPRSVAPRTECGVHTSTHQSQWCRRFAHAASLIPE